MSISSHNSLELRLGADGRGQAKIEWGPSSPRSQRTTAESIGRSEEDNARSESPRRSWTGGSVISLVSNVSTSELPLTSTGYFSDPANFPHFTECARSYLEPGSGQSLSSQTAVSLKLIFENAAQLGVFNKTTTRRPTWPEKLWALGAHWGIQEKPWPYDEFRIAPQIFDVTPVLLRVQAEVRQMQENQKKESDPLRSFIWQDSDFLSPPPYKGSALTPVDNNVHTPGTGSLPPLSDSHSKRVRDSVYDSAVAHIQDTLRSHKE